MSGSAKQSGVGKTNYFLAFMRQYLENGTEMDELVDS